MSKENEAILFYKGEYYIFSNFASFAVIYNDLTWMTSEHAYQAAKFEDKEVITLIHTALSAYDSKRVAQRYADKKRHNWDEIKIFVMEDIIRAKITMHPYIQEKLLHTGSREIVETPTKIRFGEEVQMVEVEMNLERYG